VLQVRAPLELLTDLLLAPAMAAHLLRLQEAAAAAALQVRGGSTRRSSPPIPSALCDCEHPPM
jgi:hypothetical protein